MLCLHLTVLAFSHSWSAFPYPSLPFRTSRAPKAVLKEMASGSMPRRTADDTHSQDMVSALHGTAQKEICIMVSYGSYCSMVYAYMIIHSANLPTKIPKTHKGLTLLVLIRVSR